MPSAWQTHLAAYRASHPRLNLKTCMQEASKTYRSSSSKAHSVKRTARGTSNLQRGIRYRSMENQYLHREGLTSLVHIQGFSIEIEILQGFIIEYENEGKKSVRIGPRSNIILQVNDKPLLNPRMSKASKEVQNFYSKATSLINARITGRINGTDGTLTVHMNIPTKAAMMKIDGKLREVHLKGILLRLYHEMVDIQNRPCSPSNSMSAPVPPREDAEDE